MFRAIVLAAALFSAPTVALAQEAPAEPPAASAEVEFEAKADAFAARMQTMAGEMQTAIINAGDDTAKKDTDLDAIEARYQPEVEAFAGVVEAFVNAQAAGAPPEQRASVDGAIAAALARVRAYPQQVRTQVEAAVQAARNAG